MKVRNPKSVRTWIELDKKALLSNFCVMRGLIPKKTKFLAVIKSNAYGHGLAQIAKILESGITNNELSVRKNHNSKFMIHNSRLWFGVDSIVEALRLRREGIKNNILVLGMTLPARLKDAVYSRSILTISSFPALAELAKDKNRPEFHLKIDTGMHRQGFFLSDIPKVISILKQNKLAPQGIFTHFASAKDSAAPAYTRYQLTNFKKAVDMMQEAGYKNLIKHSAASGGTLLFLDSHMDMVRVGMALYGYYPSEEASLQMGAKIRLKPVLSWRAVVGEVKEIPKDAYVGYDLTEKVSRKTKIAVIPIGYWHGYDRGLSSVGEVLIGGIRRKVLGRVSMDMIVVDVADGKRRVKAGDTVTLIGRDGRSILWADEIGLKIDTSQYEVLTRINPLIHKVIM